MLKTTCSIEPHPLLALHIYKFCATLQVLLSTQCIQYCLNCCLAFEDEPLTDDVFFAPGTGGFGDGSC